MDERRYSVCRVTGVRPLTREFIGPLLPPLKSDEHRPRTDSTFRESSRWYLKRACHSPRALFLTTLKGSVTLQGQPIRCSDFVPGVSLRTSVGQAPSVRDYQYGYAEQLWELSQSVFDEWLADVTRIPGVTLEFDPFAVMVRFARDELLELRPGVMQIDVHD